MNGYQYIKSLTVKEISHHFGCGYLTAQRVKSMDVAQMINSCLTCPQLLELNTKWPCNFQETTCKECMKEFLTKEVPGTLPVTKGPCANCMELDFCQGLIPCKKLMEYEYEKRR